MSFFNLFNKSPKKEQKQDKISTVKPWMENPLASKELQKKRYDAAMDFLEFFQGKMPLKGGNPHAGTILSVAAQLAGTSLFRAVHGQKEFPAGNVILSEEINQAYPQLLNLFALYCKQNGMDVMSKPLVTSFPEKDKPLIELDQVQAEYQEEFTKIMQKHGLDHLESARTGMVISSILFTYHCIRSKDIDPYIATGIVAMGVIQGAKTAPLPIGARPNTEVSSGTSRRFLVGDPDVVRKEGMATGATYLDVNPMILKALQEKGVDPYLVYEQGLRNEIDKKTLRIDFVKINVSDVLTEWQLKDHSKAPIPVRLAIWLKNNAATYGYIQDGNSWVLKQ